MVIKCILAGDDEGGMPKDKFAESRSTMLTSWGERVAVSRPTILTSEGERVAVEPLLVVVAIVAAVTVAMLPWQHSWAKPINNSASA